MVPRPEMSLESDYGHNEWKQEVYRLSAVFGHCAPLPVQLVANLGTSAFAIIDLQRVQQHEYVIDGQRNEIEAKG